MDIIKEEHTEAAPKRLKKRKCVIDDVVLINRERVEPLLVDFANGHPLDSGGLVATLHHNTSQDRRRRRRRALTLPTHKLTYAGTSFGGGAPTNTLTRTFLAVLDKTTGKMQLMETSKFSVRPVLGPLSSSRVDSSIAPDSSAASLTYMDKQEAVVLAFGSKRARQAVCRHRQFMVDAESMSGAISQVATRTDGEDPATLGEDWGDEHPASLLSILPPCNREAELVEEVYQLEDLAPDYFLAPLATQARPLLSSSPLPSTSEYSSLVVNLVTAARVELGDEAQLRVCCVALYIHYLLSFLATPGRKLRETPLLPQCPASVTRHILRSFTKGKMRLRTSEDEDRAMCLVLVLALIASKFELPAKLIIESLPLDWNRLRVMMRVVGANYNKATHDYVLKIPLAKVGRQTTALGRREKKRKGRL